MLADTILTFTANENPYFARSASDTQNLNWLNKINTELYREISQVIPTAYISEQEYTLVAGTTGYSLPSDFWNIDVQTQQSGDFNRKSYVNGYYDPNSASVRMLRGVDKGVLCGLFKFDSQDLLTEVWDETGKGALKAGYWIDLKNDNLEVTPANHGNTDTLKLRYLPKIAEITSLTNSIFMPRGQDYMFQMFWVWALSEIWALTEDDNTDRAYKYSQLKRLELDKILDEVKPRKKRSFGIT